ncbi:MAG: hypothetical protein K2M15_05295 [Oscillospiraceae bacterium]|nr:hypothetical protein [Oscillospiraceae bacterium]MDE7172053.1 hypothetical protein [Oscillospiraceae bacterium]
MDMRMATLENGWTGVVTERQAAAMSRTGQSGFASELSRVTEAAKQAEVSGDLDLKTAYDRLSDGSKAVLGRLKAGAADISKSEWDGLRRELKELGLITEAEYFYTHPDIVVLGKAEDFQDGGVVVVSDGPAVSFGYKTAEWTGDPFQYLDLWLELLRGERDLWAEAARQHGKPLDISPRTRQIEAHEKVSDLVKGLIELA